MVHQSALHAREQRNKYAQWLDSDDALIVANAMLHHYRPRSQYAQKPNRISRRRLSRTGGFSERLTTARIEAREKKQGAVA